VTSNQYVKKIIKQVVGQEVSRVDPTTPGYIGFRNAHMEGLSPGEAADYEIVFRNQMQFISDFKWCFLGLYMDYSNGTIDFPVPEIAGGIIGELIKAHYPSQSRLILEDKECQGFIDGYVTQFKKMLRSPVKFNTAVFEASGGKTPIDDFAGVNAHQLVNVIAIRFGELEKRGSEVAPVQSKRVLDEQGSLGIRPGDEDDADYTLILRKASAQHRAADKARGGCAIAAIVVMLVVASLTTASLNPLAVYQTDNLLAKVVVSILGALAGLWLLGILVARVSTHIQVAGLRKSVEVGTGRPARQAICPSCGLSVFQRMDTLGLPIVCHSCQVAWHDGAKCYRRGMPRSSAFIPSYPCPNCR
jgi:hypothetical protein